MHLLLIFLSVQHSGIGCHTDRSVHSQHVFITKYISGKKKSGAHSSHKDYCHTFSEVTNEEYLCV